MVAYLYTDRILQKSIIYRGSQVTFNLVGRCTGKSKVSPFMDTGSLREVDIISTLEQNGIENIEVALCFNNFRVLGVSENVDSVRGTLNSLNPIFVGRVTDTLNNISYRQTYYVFPKGRLTENNIESRLEGAF